MSQRKPMIAGNWKMNKTHREAIEFINGLAGDVKSTTSVDMVIGAPFTHLISLQEAMKGSRVQLGAQNMYYESAGAFTGEISADMLLACGCQHVILGHSERREYFQESDTLINLKVKATLKSGLNPIVCCGETLTERENGNFEDKILTQIELALNGIQMSPSYSDRIVIAYEPIWAIGTGKTCDEIEANRVLGVIRAKLARLYGNDMATKTRLLYGGSVKPATIESQIKMEHIDGALVGGASLKPDSYGELVRLTAKFGL